MPTFAPTAHIAPAQTDLTAHDAIMLSFELEAVQWAVQDAVAAVVEAEERE